jgi:catechol 2,3-dioxygenase-like lactoylglutathione lyase family enzyme
MDRPHLMFDHVTMRAEDRPESMRFYTTALRVLGLEATIPTSDGEGFPQFLVAQATDHVKPTQDLHIAFLAASRDLVDAFWTAGTEAGFTSDGEPGPRPLYRSDYYGGFLRDPDGNSVEAVHHDDAERRRENGVIDHLWVGVGDLERTRAFYETIARHAGFTTGPTNARFPDLVQFRAADGSSCSFVADGRPPTSNLHIAFPAPDRESVEAFHREAIDAGYGDNGPPGERPHYGPGYYAAFVLDPDGTNVEVVLDER